MAQWKSVGLRRERLGGGVRNLCPVVSLSKTLFSPKVLVIPRKRWHHPDLTEKLLTGTLSLNTNKQKYCLNGKDYQYTCYNRITETNFNYIYNKDIHILE